MALLEVVGVSSVKGRVYRFDVVLVPFVDDEVSDFVPESEVRC